MQDKSKKHPTHAPGLESQVSGLNEGPPQGNEMDLFSADIWLSALLDEERIRVPRTPVRPVFDNEQDSSDRRLPPGSPGRVRFSMPHSTRPTSPGPDPRGSFVSTRGIRFIQAPSYSTTPLPTPPMDLISTEALRTIGILILSFLFLPFSLLLVLYNLLTSSRVLPPFARQSRPSRPSRRRTVLITGIGMAKGLSLARAFHLSGHRVIGADFEPDPPSLTLQVPVLSALARHRPLSAVLESTRRITFTAPKWLVTPSPGRFSAALTKFVALKSPAVSLGGSITTAGAQAHVDALLALVKAEKVELWVSCASVLHAPVEGRAREVIEKQTECRVAGQFDEQTTQALHGKASFAAAARKMGIEAVPETVEVTSRAAILERLEEDKIAGAERRWLLKPVGVDDGHRPGAGRLEAALVPRETEERTRGFVGELPVSETRPWVMQRYIKGGKEFCTHALVVRGEVRVFVACPSSDLLMHYSPLGPEEGLNRAMLEFTREWVRRWEGTFMEGQGRLSGHLSFDFMVEDESNAMGVERRLYAIECNPRAHTAVVLFEGRRMREMVERYCLVCEDEEKKEMYGRTNGERVNGKEGEKGVVMPGRNVKGRYWIGHDLVELKVMPVWQILTLQIGLWTFVRRWTRFLKHVFFWEEGTFQRWDPVPFLLLYHVYWPMTVLNSLWEGKKWSRINVSTLKMFGK